MSTGGSVFEFGLDRAPKQRDGGQGMSKEVHLSCLDDLHEGAKDLVPSFAHPSQGMRDSCVAANKELADLQIIGMSANAGQRWNSNNDAIAKFFSGSHDAGTAKADAGLAAFVSGESATMTTVHTNRFTNNNKLHG